MENQMDCEKDPLKFNRFMTYPCKATLNGISREETQFYVRCQDKQFSPLEKRNTMLESYPYSLRSSVPLKMKNLEPNGTVRSSLSPAPILLEVETLFGCDDGIATCYYSDEDKPGSYIRFVDTEDVAHTQKLNAIEGELTLYYKCEDAGGNVAKNSTTFTLHVDTNPPAVARVYESGGKLKLVTIRESECSYTFDSCDFALEEGTPMPYADTKVHVADLEQDKTYHVKCRDEFVSEGADCAIVVQASDL